MSITSALVSLKGKSDAKSAFCYPRGSLDPSELLLCSSWSCSTQTNSGHKLRMTEVTDALILPKEQPQGMPWLWAGCFHGCWICCAWQNHSCRAVRMWCHHRLQVHTTQWQCFVKDVVLWSDPVLPTIKKKTNLSLDPSFPVDNS